MTPTADVFRLGVLSDLHLAPRNAVDSAFHNIIPLKRSRDLLDLALARLHGKIDALIILGDLADKAETTDYNHLFDRLSIMGTPTYLLHGNHDLPAGSGRQSGTALTAALKSHPTKNVQMVPSTPMFLGNVQALAFPLRSDSQGYQLRVKPLAAPETSTPRPLLFSSHFPVLSMKDTTTELGWPYPGDLDNREHVLHTLQNHAAPVIALSGHLHLRGHSIAKNVLQLHIAALVEPPHDASIVTITNEPTHGTVHVVRRSFTIRDTPVDSSPILDPTCTSFSWSNGSWHNGS